MEHSELLIATVCKPLVWERTENEKEYRYTAKTHLPFGTTNEEYSVVIHKAPTSQWGYASLYYDSPMHSSHVKRYICENLIEEPQMDVTELIKLAEEDYYHLLKRHVEYQERLREHEIKQVEERIRIAPYSILSNH